MLTIRALRCSHPAERQCWYSQCEWLPDLAAMARRAGSTLCPKSSRSFSIDSATPFAPSRTAHLTGIDVHGTVGHGLDFVAGRGPPEVYLRLVAVSKTCTPRRVGSWEASR